MMEVVLIICTYFDCYIAYYYLDYRIIATDYAAVVTKISFLLCRGRDEMEKYYGGFKGSDELCASS